MSRPWTKDEINFLKENYLSLKIGYREIGKILNRSYSSINHKTQRLNLKRGRIKSEITRKRLRKARLKLIKEGKVPHFQKGDLNVIKNPEIKEKARQGIKKAWKEGKFDKAMLLRKGKHYSPETEFKKGMIPWRKGKTKKNCETLIQSSKKQSIIMKRLYKEGKLIPPNLGKKFSKEHRTKLSETKKRLYAEGKLNIYNPIKNSSIEKKIQNFLKKLKIDFLTHQHIKIKHGYLVDILIPCMNVVVECDGDYFHGNINKYSILTEKQEKQKQKDKIRTKELIEKGFRVIRLWEREIKKMNIKIFKSILFNGTLKPKIF